MAVGETRPERDERNLQRFFVQVSVARRLAITPATWRMTLRSPFWRLYRMSGPGAGLRWEGGRLKLEAGVIYLVPAWVEFHTETARNLTHDYVHFYLNGLPLVWLRDAFSGPQRVEGGEALEALASRWDEALGDAAENGDVLAQYGWGLVLAQAAMACALDGLSAARRVRLKEWLESSAEVRPAMERIKRELARPPTNSELAAESGVGVDQFVRRFKDGTGMTPTQYRLERAVQEAARRLAETDEKLESIAESTGFTDRFYLSRVFRARLGVTPAVYRRAHRREGAG